MPALIAGSNGGTGIIPDRDGVINVDRGYVHRPEDCVFVSGKSSAW
ncbi:hypothetical protein ACU4GD_15785 [Cupriavidus basilensis]